MEQIACAHHVEGIGRFVEHERRGIVYQGPGQ